MDWLTDPGSWAALVTLAALEIVLGIDNIIFLSILAGKLPADQQARARVFGLAVAMLSRILLLLSLSWVMQLTQPMFTMFNRAFSGRDLILIVGGLFLLYKSVREIHDQLEPGQEAPSRGAASFAGMMVQIFLLDMVFSIDSVLTAVGMADQIGIMIAAIVIAIGVMLFFSGPIARFVEKHPTVKTLALSFLLLIGVTLVADGFGQHIPKGYIYFSVAFAVLVEMLNLRQRRAAAPKG